ncbi:sulfurtransferase TusA family protein [Desulfuromonas sp. AOP6]|uniref:sulfurtransferase TusA family protein n=1 Tax=Desulfuromonas sp. AOP6 TaxID=1566351 RepID=UPI00126CD867|nr:sulfurtransferase TusA family protein [Desulfuromonas sp. AOP6]BCA80776.1 tRNA methyltransferase [Desulfuromonas sp. AOP6]
MEILKLDIRNQICPSTLLVALKEINIHQAALRQGTLVLEVLSDNRDSTTRIAEAAENMGYGVTVDKEGAHYRLSITEKE